MNQEEKKDKKELAENERLCQVCNRIVTPQDYNPYFNACDDCVNGCGTGH